MEIQMKNVGARIKAKRNELDLTQTDIFKMCGIGSGALSRIENGTSVPSIILFYKISQALNCDMTWLLTGHSSNLKNSQADIELIEIEEKYNYLSEDNKKKLQNFLDIATLDIRNTSSNDNIKNNKHLFDNTVEYTSTHNVPILGMVAAGIPIVLVEEYMDQAVAPSDDVDFATVAKGESMEPVIHDGENIFVKSQQILDTGDIGVFDIDGETTCKRFQYDLNTKTVILTSFNSAFKPLKYSLKNYQDTFRIIGKVILTSDQEDRYHSFINK